MRGGELNMASPHDPWILQQPIDKVGHYLRPKEVVEIQRGWRGPSETVSQAQHRQQSIAHDEPRLAPENVNLREGEGRLKILNGGISCLRHGEKTVRIVLFGRDER